MNLDQSLVFAHYNSQWRVQRRLFHQHLNKETMHEYQEQIRKETFSYICRLHEKPAQFAEEYKL